MQYATPSDLAEALELMSEPGVVAIAGGSDYYPARVGGDAYGPVVDLTRLAELRGITVSAQDTRIGGLTTWTDIAAADLSGGLRALQEAAVEVGGRQVQNVGTLGGNLCNASPAADGIPPLLVVDASVEVASVSGSRTLRLTEFLVGYRKTALRSDELLTAVVIPHEASRGGSTFLKLGSRRYLVISIATACARILAASDGTVAGASVAVGACSPVALRLHELERDLLGVRIGEVGEVVNSGHLEPLSPISDVRASADYRLDAARTLVVRALERCSALS